MNETRGGLYPGGGGGADNRIYFLGQVDWPIAGRAYKRGSLKAAVYDIPLGTRTNSHWN